jgi:uncharacterized protein
VNVSKFLQPVTFTAAKLAVWAVLLLLVQPILQAQQIGNLDQQLFAAIGNRDLIAAEQLIRRGANIEARATNGLTPLMSAAESGNVPLVSLLLESGANAAAKDDQGESALSWGARGGWVKLVSLLARFSDTAAKNHALMVAIEGGPVTIEVDPAKLPPNLASPPQKEALEVEESWTATVEILLNNGADIEARDDDGSTPLDWAAAFAQTDILKLLIQRGAKTDVTDKRGNTPLISAACGCALATMNSAYNVVKILLDQGAKVNARNQDGRTALMMASGMTGDASVLQLLLDNAADPGLKDHTGKTALRIAKECRREDKIAILKTAPVH